MFVQFKSCPQNHTLMLMPESGSELWVCNICRKSHHWKREVWTCSENKRLDNGGECDYNVCRKCKDKTEVCQ